MIHADILKNTFGEIIIVFFENGKYERPIMVLEERHFKKIINQYKRDREILMKGEENDIKNNNA